MTPVYVVTDTEFDGPTPGRNSLLSVGAVAVAADGREVSAFEAVLAPFPGAEPDPGTLAWFAGEPEAWAAATRDPQPPEAVMARCKHALIHVPPIAPWARRGCARAVSGGSSS